MADTRIFVRSPYIVSVSGVAGDSTKVEIFLYNDPDSVPADPTYTLEKDIPTSEQTTCYYDVSPYCRNYIEHIKYNEVTAITASDVGEYCYCKVKAYKNGVLQTPGGDYTKELICFDGYGYHSEGYNPTVDLSLITEGSYYIEEGVNSGGLYYHNDGTHTTLEVRYTALKTGTVVTQSLTANTVGYIPYVHSSFNSEGNTLEILEDSVVTYTYTFEAVCESKYDVINCDFVNKFGAWQRLVFFKVSKDSFSVSDTEYNFMVEDIDYNVNKATRQNFNVNGKESVTCNTGWVFESYKEVIKQLMMSETILLNDKPVRLKSKSIELQKGINNNNINYQIQFDYAYHELNYNI
jgi:hypothetical protein